jgi:hypothetical protein
MSSKQMNRIFCCPNCNKRGPLNGQDYCCGHFLRRLEKTEKKKEALSSSTTWTCGTCTFVNDNSNKACDMCTLPKSNLPTQSEESGKGEEQKKKEAPSVHKPEKKEEAPSVHKPEKKEEAPSVHKPEKKKEASSVRKPEKKKEASSVRKPEKKKEASSVRKPEKKKEASSSSKTWKCGACTYINNDSKKVCGMCECPSSNLLTQAEEEKQQKYVNKPEKCTATIPGYEPIKLLKFPDGTFCSVSATMLEMPKSIDEVSMFIPLCMVIALFVANMKYFAGDKIFSPHALLEKVRPLLNFHEGQMLNIETVSRLEDILKVNIDIRFSKDRDNVNRTKNKTWKTLNPIVIVGNHYHIEGLGI